MTTISTARVYGLDGTSAQIPLPHSPADDVRLLAAIVSSETMRVLPEAVKLTRRIVPWADVILAPKVLLVRDPIPGFPTIWIEGVTCVAAGGCAVKAQSLMVLSMSAHSPASLLAAVAHEAWHLIEGRLSDEYLDRIASELITPAWAGNDPYWAKPEECRARAFEIWCRRLIEGMPGPMFVRGSGGIDEIFSMAWDGDLGRELADNERIAA